MGDFQRVYYNFTVETVKTYGRGGDDTFIVDDTAAAVDVYGDGGAGDFLNPGNDNFLIGRVLKTTTFIDNGVEIEIVDERNGDGITNGVSYNARFFGGSGDDYFEVNHNVGELELYGEAGDDTFFLKAHRQISSSGSGTTTNEIPGGNISAGAGDQEGIVNPDDEDTLIDYVENNRVEIFGGSGFDTIVIAGTSFDDKFYIYTDNTGQQFLYGAGIKLENIESIERLALITGTGDDQVWLYGLDPGLSLLLNLGSGVDHVQIGGAAQSFEVSYPASAATYTVGQSVSIEKLLSTYTATDSIKLVKRNLTTSEKIEVYREFFDQWFEGDASKVVMTPEHWNLLETNLATALYHFRAGLNAMPDSQIRYNYHPGIAAYKSNTRRILNQFAYRPGLYYQNSGRDYSSVYGRLQAGQLAQMPDRLELEDVEALLQGGALWIDKWVDGPLGLLSIDDMLYRDYLRKAVAYAHWGDFFHGHTHSPITIEGRHIVTSQVRTVAGTCRICRVWTRASIITSSLVTTKFENTATTKPVVTSWLICCPCSMRQKHSMMSPITLLKNGNPLKSMGFGPTASTSCPPEPKHAGCRHPTISQRLQV